MQINRDDLIQALMSERYYLAQYNVEETDVRLVVYSHDEHHGITYWNLATGDVSYDTVHGIACGASMIGMYDTNDALRETADDLIAQVEDQVSL